MVRNVLLVSLLAAGLTPAQAASAPLLPSSTWVLAAGNDSCELRRSFGNDEQQVDLVIAQGFRLDAVDLILVTPARAKTPGFVAATVSLGADTLPGDFRSGIYASSRPGKSIWKTSGLAVSQLNRAMPSDNLSIMIKNSADISLQIGSFSPAAAALQDCQRSRFKKIGVDYDQYSKLQQLPEPQGSPELWVTYQDYPDAALQQRAEGRTEFKLDVSATGTVTSCDIIVSSGNAALDQATCTNMRARAMFKPARDQDGQPAAGPWFSKVNWKYPG